MNDDGDSRQTGHRSDGLAARVQADGTSVEETLEHAQSEGKNPDLDARGAAFEGMAHALTLPFEEEADLGEAHCQRCEVLPRPLVGPGTLLINVPHTHTLGKSMRWLHDSGVAFTEEEGVITIRVPAGSLDPLIRPFCEQLTSTERRMTRVIYRPDEVVPQRVNAFDVEDIVTFSARAGSGWLLDLLRNRRFTVYFQPIVRADDGATVYAYECLLRGLSPEGLIPPGRIFSAAAQADLLFQTDMAARRTALLAAAEHRIAERVFVNFTPNSLFDPRFCLDSTVRLVDELRLPREQIVFEVTESERLPETEHLKAIVAYYRDKGFRVALDDVGAGYASLQALLDVRPDYAKVDMTLVRDVHRDERKSILTGKLIETARELGSQTLFEGVEAEAEWAWARERGVEYAQGYLFGRPLPQPVGPS